MCSESKLSNFSSPGGCFCLDVHFLQSSLDTHLSCPGKTALKYTRRPQTIWKGARRYRKMQTVIASLLRHLSYPGGWRHTAAILNKLKCILSHPFLLLRAAPHLERKKTSLVILIYGIKALVFRDSIITCNCILNLFYPLYQWWI